ncbi:DUF975 family protein [Butyrivibrio sp. FCS014]|uniref:DUF975 family protein n=1 Tax=Butyrivibrio sp. FCS014 TaxID=1408304 RepID=UPI000463F940|nr:DUF975 family protein [Butyrivibrio sp. FCS014]
MWTRKELKEKGKKAFILNYWKTVLVSLIYVILIAGAAGSVSGIGVRGGSDHKIESTIESNTSQSDSASTIAENFSDKVPDFDLPPEAVFVIAVLAVMLGIVAFGISLAINAFLINPIEVGCHRFFTRNLNQKANVNEITYAFDHNYLNNVKTAFLRDLYIILWSLLFIIPGIIKSYEYRMIPYILADHPEMSTKEVFAKSKELMNGQKWRAFVLDLSFIGWEILSLFTARILGIFYVSPYRNMTNAALYEKLEYGNLEIEENN